MVWGQAGNRPLPGPLISHITDIYASPGFSVFRVFSWIETSEFLAATKQLYKWYFPSVRPSVCLSVRPSVTPFWLCSHHRIIMKFSGVITSDRSDVHAKGQGQRSKVKVTEVTTQLYRFRTVTPVWIHVWSWNDAYSLIMLRRGALLFLAATKQLYKWYFPSVCPSVRLSICPSVRHTFLTMFPSSYHHEIFRSYYQWPT